MRSEKKSFQNKIKPSHIKLRIPKYLMDFHCIGGICQDNCCIGWQVEIDQVTFQKYQKIQDKELRQLIGQHVYQNSECYDPQIDFGCVTLKKENRCPFLDHENLCKIQKKLGHDFLSNVCATYPRYTNQVNNILECSANISCPEAARLILNEKDGIRFLEIDFIPSQRNIINISLDQKKHQGNLMIQYFEEFRNITISALQDHSLPLWKQLTQLGCFYDTADAFIKNNNQKSLHAFLVKTIDTQNQKKTKSQNQKPAPNRIKNQSLGQNSSLLQAQPTNKTKPNSYLALSKLLKSSEQKTKIDSAAYLKMAKEWNLVTETEYENAYRHWYLPFQEAHRYLLENYLVNYVFGGLFPASESTSPFESFMMLLFRYVLIRRRIIELAAFRGDLNIEQCISLIQTFSKAIEHHYTYLEIMAKQCKQNHNMNLSFAQLLLAEH